MATTNTNLHIVSSEKQRISVEQAKQMIQEAMEKKAATVSPDNKVANYEFNIPVEREPRTFTMVQNEENLDWENSDTKSDQTRLDNESQRLYNQHCLCEEEISRMRDKFLHLKPSGSNFDRDQATSLINKYTFDQMKSIYKKDAKGQLRFHMSFQLNNFEVENIQVQCSNYRLQIIAQQTKNQFSRSLNLPRTLDLKQIKCSFTQDGVLLLEAPVLPSTDTPRDSNVITLDQFNSSSMSRSKQLDDLSWQKMAAPSSHMQMVEENRLFNIQLSVGKEFSSEEVKLSIKGNHLRVCASHENKQSSCAAFREFEKQYELPKDTDCDHLKATLSNGILRIQVPLKQNTGEFSTETIENHLRKMSLVTNQDDRNSSIFQDSNCRMIDIIKE